MKREELNKHIGKYVVLTLKSGCPACGTLQNGLLGDEDGDWFDYLIHHNWYTLRPLDLSFNRKDILDCKEINYDRND